MTTPTGEQPAAGAPVTPTVSTAPPRWWSRVPSHLGRARTSTVVLGLLFLAVGLLYLSVRPDPPPTVAVPTGGDTVVPAPVEPAPTEEEPTTTAPTETTSAPTTPDEEPTTPGEETTTPEEGPTTPDEEPTTDPPTGTTTPEDTGTVSPRSRAPGTTQPVPTVSPPGD